ncbi:MAG: hypothetical protein IPK99_07820 [Flavobacteriales bacterium]|nr:hypothetical protein [Flavobacteriales bacterium]
MFRKSSFSLLALFLPLLALAQPTQPFLGMHYQAVVRNASGDPLPNQTIGVEFTVTFGLAFAYKETQTLTTDAQGLLTAVIGFGTPTGGQFPTFTQIEWYSATLYGLIVLMDLNGGTNYTLNASQQFRCVPFAALSRQALMLSDSAWVAEPFDNRVWSDSNYDVGIGTQTPQAKLHVAGNVRIADGTQAAGRVLTSDADGDAVWSTVVSAGNYTATWTSTGGFTSAPTAPSCSYSRVGNVVHVVCRFGGAGPTYSAGTNTATLTVPPGLPIASPPNGDLVSGTFISDHYRNGAQTSVGIVANNTATTVFLKMNGSSAGVAGSYCDFTYRTSAP